MAIGMIEGERIKAYAKQRGLLPVELPYPANATVGELREAATGLGLTVPSKARKHEIQKMIQGEALRSLLPRLTARQRRRIKKKGI